jgi:hypothetical protein
MKGDIIPEKKNLPLLKHVHSIGEDKISRAQNMR